MEHIVGAKTVPRSVTEAQRFELLLPVVAVGS